MVGSVPSKVRVHSPALIALTLSHLPYPPSLSLYLYYVISRGTFWFVQRARVLNHLPRSAQTSSGSNIESILLLPLFLHARRDNLRNYTQLLAPCNFVSVKALLAGSPGSIRLRGPIRVLGLLFFPDSVSRFPLPPSGGDFHVKSLVPAESPSSASPGGRVDGHGSRDIRGQAAIKDKRCPNVTSFPMRYPGTVPFPPCPL